ncbi:terminase small subunit [Mucilaginibacter sp. HMF5004]|uniref:terminase small subunit n=1 Tax=Mucilaginibacter rivuli TaxID=2857527 RepID=UPI001C5FE4A8|nr:terminase small subunit [Mucilaginibacter rivuli]MBW4890991.1 terminase small subunit [Mucilaginibacter rivuli]
MTTVLTPKQQKFCDEYLIDFNATKAALRAGYSGPTALSGQLMLFPKIKAYLSERTEQVQKKAQVTQEMVIAELMKVAFGNMGSFFGEDGKPKNMTEMTDDEKAALWNIRVSEKNGELTMTIKMHNKMAALDKLAKFTGLYEHKEPRKVEYVHLSKEQMDHLDAFDDESFKEKEEDEDDFEYDNDKKESESLDDIETREVSEKEIHVNAVRETELRCRREFENELAVIKQHYADMAEKRLVEEAKKIGVPSRKFVEMMRGHG